MLRILDIIKTIKRKKLIAAVFQLCSLSSVLTGCNISQAAKRFEKWESEGGRAGGGSGRGTPPVGVRWPGPGNFSAKCELKYAF
jgi:hypothetical protein